MAEQIGLETSGRDLEFLADVPQRLEAEVARAETSTKNRISGYVKPPHRQITICPA